METDIRFDGLNTPQFCLGSIASDSKMNHDHREDNFNKSFNVVEMTYSQCSWVFSKVSTRRLWTLQAVD